MQIVQENREKSRLIESADRRIVHFIFDSKKPCLETAFAQKFSKMMAEELEEFQNQQDEDFEAYVEQIAKEEDENDLDNPIKFEPNQYQELELRDLHRIAFAVADSPFQKTDVSKYYPEIHIIGGNGDVVATISPSNKAHEKYGGSNYCENFRDEKLKINDDRKVKLTLSDFQEENTMILLTVKTNDLKKEKVKATDYAKAWFRL